MAGAKSKNSRTVASPGQQKAQLIGDSKLIISCNAGKNAYVYVLVTGTTPHMATDSDAFVEAVRSNSAEGYAAKQRAELEVLAAANTTWAATLTRLDAAGALA